MYDADQSIQRTSASRLLYALALGLLFCSGCALGPRAGFLSAAPGGSNAYLLHLPGISGERWLDREMVKGLRDGGFDGTIEIYDWTQEDPGLDALFASQRNRTEAQKVADIVQARFRADPACKITLLSHSGGAGPTVWALERLPADVKIDTLVLLSPALSQGYDLSKALSHVTNKAYVFCSTGDSFVLGIGTRMFGTIDGLKEDAAGMRGFRKPVGAEDAQYQKLIQYPYDDRWMTMDNLGDHIGTMSRPFAQNVVAPLVEGKRPSVLPHEMRAVTRPATTRS